MSEHSGRDLIPLVLVVDSRDDPGAYLTSDEGHYPVSAVYVEDGRLVVVLDHEGLIRATRA